MRYAWVIAFASVVCGAQIAEAGGRHALVVGTNHGDRRDVALRYAEQDAERIAEILQTLGGFEPSDVVLMTGVDADAVRDALARVEARMAKEGDGSLLMVFYSGHADAEALKLAGTRLPLAELRTAVQASSAKARVLVLDACRSGVLTRVKGGRPAPAFEVFDELQQSTAEGLAIMASSAAGEDAQESDELQASFFTHFLASALLGAADRDRNSEVTLGEAFAYASGRTLAATSATFAGPQHPTYHIDLKGRDDLVLTSVGRTTRRAGILRFAEPGLYFIEKLGDGAHPVAELSVGSDYERPLALPEGDYRVTRRGSDHLLVGEYRVDSGHPKDVREDRMDRVEYARMVRKGGSSTEASVSAFALGGARAPFLELGTTWSALVGARYDTRHVGLELRLAGGSALQSNDRLQVSTRDFAVTGAVVHSIDIGRLTTSLGLELGGTWIKQSFDDPSTADRSSFGLRVGPLAGAELHFGRIYLRAELGLPLYVLRVANESGGAAILGRLVPSGGAGFGVSL